MKRGSTEISGGQYIYNKYAGGQSRAKSTAGQSHAWQRLDGSERGRQRARTAATPVHDIQRSTERNGPHDRDIARWE